MATSSEARPAARLPRFAPMLAYPSEELPRDESDWAFEFKWDGVRALVYIESGSLTVLSRGGRDVTVAYPELGAMVAALHGREVVLDGEIVTLDERGRPSFAILQTRMHVANAAKARRLALEQPVAFVAFDVLYVDGAARIETPYRQRRGLLESLGLSGPNWHVPPSFEKDGAELMRASREQGLEGVVCKRLDSRYLPGSRSRAWLKVKHEHVQEVVIGGWRPGSGSRSRRIGSLLTGVYDGARLVYSGRVGTGFSDRALDELMSRLVPIERPAPPFAGQLPRADISDAHWVEPRLVGEVRFSEWTPDGRLRQPAWRGLRSDKSPQDVKREN